MTIQKKVLELKNQGLKVSEIYAKFQEENVATTKNSIKFYFYAKKRLAAKTADKID